jgi:hypothetical protein
MFCSICKTEYRQGFTKCADCGVALVDHLPTGGPSGDEDAPRDSEGRELLWSGLSAKLYDAIRDALDDAGIAHNDVEKEFGVLPTFEQTAQLVWVNPHDRDAARSILREVLDRPEAAEQHDEELASDAGRMNLFGLSRRNYNVPPRADNAPATTDDEELTESDADTEPPDDAPEDFRPEEATSQVWAGDDVDTAQFLKDSLSGIGIGCVVSEDGSKSRVLVLPADEKRAREIVREVVEGAPPE